MSDIKLSGEFQPNVYLDFGQGKIFSNRWARGYIPFKTKSDEHEPLHVLATKEDGTLYDTGIECPSTLMCLDPDKERNIKVDIFNGIELTGADEIIHLSKWNTRFDYLYSKWMDNIKLTSEEEDELWRLYDDIFTSNGWATPIHDDVGVNYYTKPPESSGDLLKYEEWYLEFPGWSGYIVEPVVIRPQALCMPMIRPVIKDIKGVPTSFTEMKVEEDDTYTITVLPNQFHWLCPDAISNTVLLFADKRRLMAESYLDEDQITEYFRPDKTIDYSVDNIDNYCGKFKINGEFVDLILLHTGTTITLKAVYDHVTIDGKEKDIVYWNVENPNAFKEFTELKNNDIAFYFKYKIGEEVIEREINPTPALVTYCSNLYNGTLDVDRNQRIPISITMNIMDNCFENAFYLQENSWCE